MLIFPWNLCDGIGKRGVKNCTYVMKNDFEATFFHNIILVIFVNMLEKREKFPSRFRFFWTINFSCFYLPFFGRSMIEKLVLCGTHMAKEIVCMKWLRFLLRFWLRYWTMTLRFILNFRRKFFKKIINKSKEFFK